LLLLQDGQDGLKLNVRASSKRQETETAPEELKKRTGFQQTVVDDDTQAVKISLNDCLACSGCVTSAETVLLQHQSLKEFVAKCGDPDTIVVVSVSPQSRASLAGESSSRRLHAQHAVQSQRSSGCSPLQQHSLPRLSCYNSVVPAGQQLALNPPPAHRNMHGVMKKPLLPPACVNAAVLPLAALHGLSAEDVQGRLSTFLTHQLSVALVLDLGLGSALALTEAAAEFVAR
jgi:iron only hydrogenase large subunit-like protein